MGVYSEAIDDQRVLEKSRGLRNLLMVVCPGCACESLSYSQGVPNRVLASEGKDMEQTALAVGQEADRIEGLLTSQGIKVERLLITFPCEMLEKEEKTIVDKAQGKDGVLVLACSGGTVGIRDVLIDMSIPIIPLMKTAGYFVFHLVADETGQYSVVDRKKSRIIRGKHDS